MYEKPYKKLITYMQSEEIYDLTVVFCNRYLSGGQNLRLYEQVVHAARSCKQNIAEGASQGTSLKGYIKLLGIARGSLEELLEDYKDFSRQKNIPLLGKGDEMVNKVKKVNRVEREKILFPFIPSSPSLPSLPSFLCLSYLLDLIIRTNYLLDRQIKSLEEKFVREGGYSENLLKKRLFRLRRNP